MVFPLPPFQHLGIVAGGGALPVLLAQAAREQGWKTTVIAFDGLTDPAAVEGLPSHWLPMKRIAYALDLAQEGGIDAVVLAGRMKRPPLSTLATSRKTQKLLARLGPVALAGDDALLRGIVEIVEEEGLRVIAPDALLTGLLMPSGMLSARSLDEGLRRDLHIGALAAWDIGARDLGQSVIVQDGAVLDVEGADGTDALIRHCASLRQKPGGLLVKCKKPAQERRVDLPAIGLETLRHLHAGGFAGLAAEAGGSLLLQREECIAYANTHDLLLYGFTPKEIPDGS